MPGFGSGSLERIVRDFGSQTSLAGRTAADSGVDLTGSCYDHVNDALELGFRMTVLR